VFTGNLGGGLWIAFIGWFLDSAASAQVQQVIFQGALAGHKVSQVVSTGCASGVDETRCIVGGPVSRITGKSLCRNPVLGGLRCVLPRSYRHHVGSNHVRRTQGSAAQHPCWYHGRDRFERKGLPSDEQRRKFIRQYYWQDFEDVRFYDIIFNTDRASAKQVASSILAFMNHSEAGAAGGETPKARA
jgi:hypothetical protein